MIQRLHVKAPLLPPIALAFVLVWLGVDWALSETTWTETMARAILGGGGLALLVLKWRFSRRQNGQED